MLVNIFNGAWNAGYLLDSGRNLLRDSSLIQINSNNANLYPIKLTPMVENGIHFYRVTRTSTDLNPDRISLYTFISKNNFLYDKMTGRQVTLSFKCRSSHKTAYNCYCIYTQPDTTLSKDLERIEVTTEWKTFQTTIPLFPDLSDYSGIRLNPSNTTIPDGEIDSYYIDIGEYKFELSSTATPWSPAPEDTFELGTAHPDSIFTDFIPVKKNTQYEYGFANQNSLPTHTIRYMKSDGTYIKSVNVDEDLTKGLKNIVFDDDYNIEIMFQNGLSDNEKINFKFKEENNMAIKATAQTTIIDITDAYSVMLSSEAYTFSGGTGGVGSGQTCVTEAFAYCGSNQCASVSVNAADITCPTGISATVENSGSARVKITFKTTATVSASCEATIPVVVDGITINKRFSFAVAKTGNTGATGKGISSTKTQYVVSSSNTTIPTSGWQDAIPSAQPGQFLWTRVTITYTDNTSTSSYSVAKQGSTGATGTTGSQWYSGTGITGTSTTATTFTGSGVANARVNDMYLNTSTGNTYKCTTAGNAQTAKWVYEGSIKGIQGDKGDTGSTGNGISKAEITYAKSTSNTTAPTSGWQSTPPSVDAGSYLWTKTVFTYTNGGTATQYSVAKQGSTGAAGSDAITGSITLSNGNIFKNNTGSTTLTAHVWKGSTEQQITDAGVCGSLGSIKWYTTASADPIATAKSITVSAADVTNVASYYFQLEG